MLGNYFLRVTSPKLVARAATVPQLSLKNVRKHYAEKDDSLSKGLIQLMDLQHDTPIKVKQEMEKLEIAEALQHLTELMRVVCCSLIHHLSFVTNTCFCLGKQNPHGYRTLAEVDSDRTGLCKLCHCNRNSTGARYLSSALHPEHSGNIIGCLRVGEGKWENMACCREGRWIDRG